MVEQGIRAAVGVRIRATRDGLGMSRAALEERAGVSGRVIAKIEHGRTKWIQLEQVHALARAMRVDPVTLVTGKPSGVTMWDVFPAAEEWADLIRDRLRAARLAAGKGTKRLAADAKVAQTWLVRIESGEVQTIDFVRIERLARSLGIELHHLINPASEKREAHAERQHRASA